MNLSEPKPKIVYEYTIPASLLEDGAPATIGMRQLTAEQELMATKIGKFDYTRTQYAATKLSIVELNGKPVDVASEEVDRFWERANPKMRSLLLQVYNKLTSPSSEEEQSFLGSEVVRTA